MSNGDGDILVQKTFTFHTNEKLGCTHLVRVSQSGSTQRFVGKVVLANKLQEFLLLEGSARRVLHSSPHPSIHPLIFSAEEEAVFPAPAASSAPSSSSSPSPSPVPSSSRPLSPSSPAPSQSQSSPLMQRAGFLVFPSLDCDLHTYVRAKGFLTEAQARPLFAQIVSAVAHCHQHNVVLRDMKLGKMYFTDKTQSRAVIADLDGAQLVSEHDSTLCDQKGSPAYVSPEVLLCQPYDGKAADVWALGVVLFVILTGTYPFQDNRPTNLFQKIQQAAAGVTFPSTMSERAKKLIKRLLSKDPARRPSAQDLLDEPWLVAPESPTSRALASGSESARAEASEEDEDVFGSSDAAWSREDFEVPDVGSPPVVRSTKIAGASETQRPKSSLTLRIDASGSPLPQNSAPAVSVLAPPIPSPSMQNVALFFRDSVTSAAAGPSVIMATSPSPASLVASSSTSSSRSSSPTPSTSSQYELGHAPSSSSASLAPSADSSTTASPVASRQGAGLRRNLSLVKRRTSLSLEEEVSASSTSDGSEASASKKPAPIPESTEISRTTTLV